MKAILFEKFGGVEVLHMGQVEKPTIAPNELLIKVSYAGVNPVDWKIREGYLSARMPHHFPIIPGWDVSGVVEEIGKDVQGFSIGDAVFSYVRKPEIQWGSYAEYISFHANDVVKIPDSIPLHIAASLPLISLTAWQALFDTVHLKKNQTILILNGSGGVGSMAIQFAKYAGATVVTTASPHKYEYVTKFKPDSILDYTSENFVNDAQERYPKGFDVIFDCVGGDSMKQSLQLLAPNGIFVSIVDKQAVDHAISQGINAQYVFVAPNGMQLKMIRDLLVDNVILPPHVEILPLEEAKKAQEKQKSGKVGGKLVLQIS